MATYRSVARRQVAAESADPLPVVAKEEPQGFESMTKAQLVNTAKAQNIDSSGTKADIIERLRDVDRGD